MNRKIAGIIIIGFWLIMMVMLVQRELYVTNPPAESTGYAALIRSGLLDNESQLGIYLHGSRIGSTRISAWQHRGFYEIDNLTRLQLPILGSDRPSSIHALLRIDRNFQLVDFTGTLILAAPALRLNLEGKVVSGEVQLKFKEGKEIVFETSMPYRQGDMIANIFSPLGPAPDLEVGKTWRIRMFNPLTREFETAIAKVEAAEAKQQQDTGESVELFKVLVIGPSVEAIAWIDKSGEVIEQEIPRYGLRLIKEKPGSLGENSE